MELPDVSIPYQVNKFLQELLVALYRLYIDVGQIVGPGRKWRPPSPLFTSGPIFLIFLFSPPYILFLVFF
jgi:hypothetical protein